MSQTRKAIKKLHPRSILLVGGVACNSHLRLAFKKTFEEIDAVARVYYPSPALTTDNGVMIAAAGASRLNASSSLQLDLNAYPDLRLC
jgi:N6-L-threonylcarbamoyladenine synthase